MANLKSSKKDIRRNERRRLKNRSQKSLLKTIRKKILTFLEKKNIEEAKKVFNQYVSLLDKAAKVKLIHKQQADRRKSRTALLINKVEKELLHSK